MRFWINCLKVKRNKLKLPQSISVSYLLNTYTFIELCKKYIVIDRLNNRIIRAYNGARFDIVF